MGGGKKKRKRSDNDAADLGMGRTLSLLKGDDVAYIDKQSKDREASDSGEWETVKRKKKINSPSLKYSELHKLQNTLKLGDLQALVLYCLADGPSPQWVSVPHHHMVQKAVVLLVPGLEKGMFDWSLPLIEPEPGASNPLSNIEEDMITTPKRWTTKPSEERDRIANDGHSNRIIQPKPTDPDTYLPLKLDNDQLPEPVKPLAQHFPHVWPIKAPGDDRMNKVHSPLQAMLQSPISRTQAEKQMKGAKPVSVSKDWADQRTSIVQYLAKSEDLLDSEYVLHPACWEDAGLDSIKESERRTRQEQTAAEGWIDTKVSKYEDGAVPEAGIEKGSITAGRKVLSMDCEMCTVKGGQSALTRISLTDWGGEIVMDEYVKPNLPIIDYLTQYSGITPAKLENVTTTLSDIQKRLLFILTPHTILIGHSLNSDLSALKLTHPYIIDTSLLYPHPRGPPMRSSLKWLVQKYLNREIQKGHGATGHDSVEDAHACLDLVRLKCEKGPAWGTQEATREPIFKRIKRSSAPSGNTSSYISPSRSGAIIDHGAPDKNFGQMADYCISCSTDSEVVTGVKRAVLGDEDGVYIPGGGVGLTWARLRGLEYVRGWRNDIRGVSSGTSEPSAGALAKAVSQMVANIEAVRMALPPCTLFIVYSGTGDPRGMVALQERHRTFKSEYKTKKWDEIKDKWTDSEEQALKEACKKARAGVGLLCIT